MTLALAVDASVGGVEFRGTFVGGLYLPGMTNPLFFRMSAGIIAGAGLRLDALLSAKATAILAAHFSAVAA